MFIENRRLNHDSKACSDVCIAGAAPAGLHTYSREHSRIV